VILSRKRISIRISPIVNIFVDESPFLEYVIGTNNQWLTVTFQ
jgi:hypothetical protein